MEAVEAGDVDGGFGVGPDPLVDFGAELAELAEGEGPAVCVWDGPSFSGEEDGVFLEERFLDRPKGSEPRVSDKLGNNRNTRVSIRYVLDLVVGTLTGESCLFKDLL